MLEVQQNHDHDLWRWICKQHWIPRLESTTWKFSGQHQCNTMDEILFIVFYSGMYMCLILYVWCTYALCNIPNLQIKCKFYVAFKVFMFL